MFCLARYLNVPPTAARLDDLTAFGEMIRAALLNAFDRQRQDSF